MIRAWKRPEISRRRRQQLQHDLVAAHIVGEISGRDRQLIASKHLREAAAHQAVRAVGAEHEGRAVCGGISREDDAVTFDRHVEHADRQVRDTSVHRRREQRAVENLAARDNERAVIEVNDDGLARCVRQPDASVQQEPCGSNRDAANRVTTHRAANEIERPPRDSTAAWFFARVRRIEQPDASAFPREQPRSMRAGGAGADDGDIKVLQSGSLVVLD